MAEVDGKSLRFIAFLTSSYPKMFSGLLFKPNGANPFDESCMKTKTDNSYYTIQLQSKEWLSKF